MLDFDSELDTKPTPSGVVSAERVTQITEAAPRVVEQVRVASVQGRTFLAKPEALWNWSDLRDYILGEIVSIHGPQVRNSVTEASICKSFISRWGIEQAVLIARVAFEVHGGYWHNAPISINRFAKASDPWFAERIAADLST